MKWFLLVALFATIGYLCNVDAMATCELSHSHNVCFQEINR